MRSHSRPLRAILIAALFGVTLLVTATQPAQAARPKDESGGAVVRCKMISVKPKPAPGVTSTYTFRWTANAYATGVSVEAYVHGEGPNGRAKGVLSRSYNLKPSSSRTVTITYKAPKRIKKAASYGVGFEGHVFTWAGNPTPIVRGQCTPFWWW